MLCSGLFLFGCHPDLFFQAASWNQETEAASRDIIACAKDLEIPLEVNGYGIRKAPVGPPYGDRPPYPMKEFWSIANEEGIRVCCNSDAHILDVVAGKVIDGFPNECFQFASEVGLHYVDWNVEQGRICSEKN